jgi:KaiC/GvpD/RAD55 family RecA-like ATPase
VGRATESQRLHRFIAGIADQGGALSLSGEAGVGKTALLDEAAAQAIADGGTAHERVRFS